MKITDRLKTIPVTLVLIGMDVLVFLFTVLTGMDMWRGNGAQQMKKDYPVDHLPSC